MKLEAASGWCAPEPPTVSVPMWLSEGYQATDYSAEDIAWIDKQWDLANKPLRRLLLNELWPFSWPLKEKQ